MTATSKKTDAAPAARRIEMWAVEDLTPYAGNARKHPPEQVSQIAGSIQRFGFTMPILVAEDGTIIAGHGRLQAATQLGMAEVPVMVARGWSDEDRRLYTLADNRLAETSEWDTDLLRLELDALQLTVDTADLDAIGFSAEEIASLLPELGSGTEGNTDPDEVPEPPKVAWSVVGDVWLLGAHRLTCGDCTDPVAVARALNGAKPHLMVTDPPYGVVYDADWRSTAKNADGSLLSTGKGRAKGKVLNDDKADWREAWALFPGEVAYVWHAGLSASIVADSLTACGFALRSQIIWAKNNFAVGRGDYHWHHEPCWYAVSQKGKGHYNGDRTQSTIWQIDKPKKSETGHSTQKPVECMKRPIENNSKPGDAIYEPFSGSGTTIIAGEMTGRIVLAVELNPVYVDLAVTRWQQFTGLDAINEATGQTFNEVVAARQKAKAA